MVFLIAYSHRIFVLNCRAINKKATRMPVIMSWDGCMILWILISFSSLKQYVPISSFLTLSLSILVTYHIYVFLYLLNIDPMDVSKPACWKRNRSNRRAVAYHVSYLIMDEVIFLGIGLMLIRYSSRVLLLRLLGLLFCLNDV